MSKTMKRILVFAVSFMMIVSSASVFAAEELTGIDVKEEGAPAKKVEERSPKKELKASDKKELESKGLEEGAYYTAPSLNYTSSSLGDGFVATNGYYYTIDVKTSGRLLFSAQAADSNTYSVTVEVGDDEYSAANKAYLSAGESIDFAGGYDVKAGVTYRLDVTSSGNKGTQKVAVIPYVLPYATRTLPQGKVMITSGLKGDSNATTTALFKIKAAKTGYISVNLKEYGYDNTGGYVTLLNSKKKAVSDKLWYYSNSKTSYVVFGVKKGTTYYLKVSGTCGSYKYGYMFGTKWKNYGASFAKNLKKGKSLKLKRKGKARNMARPATGKKMVQWYKFKVPKKQKTVLKVNAGNIKSGSAKLVLYAGKKKIGTATVRPGYKHTFTITNGTTYGKANKGTYYAAIVTSAKCSGQYKIQYAK